MSLLRLFIVGSTLACGAAFGLVKGYEEAKPAVAKWYNNKLLTHEYSKLTEKADADTISYTEGITDYTKFNRNMGSFTEFNRDSSTVHFNNGDEMRVSNVTWEAYRSKQELK